MYGWSMSTMTHRSVSSLAELFQLLERVGMPLAVHGLSAVIRGCASYGATEAVADDEAGNWRGLSEGCVAAVKQDAADSDNAAKGTRLFLGGRRRLRRLGSRI